MADREVRKWKLERDKWAFRLGATIYGTIAVMYFVINPITSSYGHPLDLPDGKLTVTVLTVLATPVFSISPRQLLYALGVVLSKLPEEEPHDGSGGP